MTKIENSLQVATRIFDESIYGIRDSQIEGLNNIAGRTANRIRKGELFVVVNNSDFNIPTITGFDLAEIAPGPRAKYVPVIVVDMGKILDEKPETVKGDLVRTVAIADQYPLNGFQRRYKAVYEDALQAQTKWLISTNTPNIFLDPRTTDRETLFQDLLGDARYFSDFGFEDWQKAIEDYRKSGQDIGAIPILDQLKEATAQFLVMRQRFIPINYYVARQKIGEAYLNEWDADKRAETMAYSLMGASIYARIREN